MARVDYFEIEEELAEILRAAPELDGVPVRVEEEIEHCQNNTIFIHLVRREAPDDEQRISAGRSTEYLLTIAVWCYGFGMDLPAAMKARDDLLGRTELVLMQNRSINDKVSGARLRGGEFENRKDDAGELLFLAGAEIEVECNVRAIV